VGGLEPQHRRTIAIGSNCRRPVRIACRALTVFSTIAEAAGPNLNSESFGAALDELGEFNLPGTGTGTASLGDGKYDALDDLRLWIQTPDAAKDELTRGHTIAENPKRQRNKCCLFETANTCMQELRTRPCGVFAVVPAPYTDWGLMGC
jgi:hypothetical protein